MSAPSRPPHPSAIAVRDARPGDVPAIQRIYAQHVLTGVASFEEIPPTVDEIAQRMETVLGFGAPYLVGEIDGRVSGYAYAGPFRLRPAYRYTVEDSIYVDPDATGRGLGTRLLGTLIERCTGAGYRQMIAVIGGSDNLPSITLHKRLGFAHAGTLNATGFKFGGWVDTVLMQRALAPGGVEPPEA